MHEQFPYAYSLQPRLVPILKSTITRTVPSIVPPNCTTLHVYERNKTCFEGLACLTALKRIYRLSTLRFALQLSSIVIVRVTILRDALLLQDSICTLVLFSILSSAFFDMVSTTRRCPSEVSTAGILSTPNSPAGPCS